MLPSLRKRARKSASGLSTLPSSLSWKTPSAKPMHSFPPMTKTPLCGALLRHRRRYAGRFFAGQQETFLNVQGFDAVLVAVKHVFASLFNDRAISYRVHQGYDHRGVALSAGVQRMVRSDLASSGVMFSIDTESGFDQVVFITSAWGLGEMVVQGAVNPDEFYVHKPTLAANRPAIVRRTMGSKNPHGLRADPGARQAG